MITLKQFSAVIIVIAFTLGVFSSTFKDPYAILLAMGSILLLYLLFNAQSEGKSERKANKRFYILSEDSPNLTWTCAANGAINYFNRKWFEYTGFPRTTPPYYNYSQAIHFDDFDEFRKKWNNCRRARIPFEMEFRFKKQDGTFRWQLARCVPVLNRRGTLIQWVGTATDIDDHKRAENENYLNVKRLEQERDSREAFVNLLSHDLRNPLTAARITTEILFRYADRIKSRPELIENILSNIDRADRMIQDLLDANRIRAGEELFLDMEPVELVSTCHDALKNIKIIYGDRFNLIAPEQLRGVWDKQSMHRLIENLVSNAAKYGDPAQPIEIKLDDLGSERRIAVHNSGPAIPPQELELLFKSFKRCAGTHSKPGWGLGLTLVKGIATSHGGYVEVKSTSEGGTTFTVTIPTDSSIHKNISNHAS